MTTDKSPEPIERRNRLVEREDIFLLLESYKNNIAISTTLLEHQKQLIEKQSDVIEILKDAIKLQIEIKKDFADSRVEVVKEFNKIKVLIYIALGGMLSVISTLVGFMVNLSDKFSLLKSIAIKLGVNLF